MDVPALEARSWDVTSVTLLRPSSPPSNRLSRYSDPLTFFHFESAEERSERERRREERARSEGGWRRGRSEKIAWRGRGEGREVLI